MILILKMEDGSTRTFEPADSLRMLLSAIQRTDVATIVCGAVEGEKVLWEKQFNAVDVMLKEFGKPRK